MRGEPYRVKSRTLLLVACLVWLAAGVNVARVGLDSMRGQVTALTGALALAVFGLFGWFVFWPLVERHRRRIEGYGLSLQPFWRFFDRKSFIVMAVMILLGVTLRVGHLASDWFIAWFYTGLGAALSLAGLGFGWYYLVWPYGEEKEKP